MTTPTISDKIKPLLSVVAAAGFDPPGLAGLRIVHHKYPLGTRERMIEAEPFVKLLVAYFDKNLNGGVVSAAATFLRGMGKDTRQLENIRQYMTAVKHAMTQPVYAARIYNRLPAIVAKYPPGHSLAILGDPDFYAMVSHERLPAAL